MPNIRHAYNSAWRRARNAERRAHRYLRAHPFQTTLVAAGLGAATGAVLTAAARSRH